MLVNKEDMKEANKRGLTIVDDILSEPSVPSHLTVPVSEKSQSSLNQIFMVVKDSLSAVTPTTVPLGARCYNFKTLLSPGMLIFLLTQLTTTKLFCYFLILFQKSSNLSFAQINTSEIIDIALF